MKQPTVKLILHTGNPQNILGVAKQSIRIQDEGGEDFGFNLVFDKHTHIKTYIKLNKFKDNVQSELLHFITFNCTSFGLILE